MLGIETKRLTGSGFFMVSFFDENDNFIESIVTRKLYHETMFDFLYRVIFKEGVMTCAIAIETIKKDHKFYPFLPVKHFDLNTRYTDNQQYFSTFLYAL